MEECVVDGNTEVAVTDVTDCAEDGNVEGAETADVRSVDAAVLSGTEAVSTGPF